MRPVLNCPRGSVPLSESGLLSHFQHKHSLYVSVLAQVSVREFLVSSNRWVCISCLQLKSCGGSRGRRPQCKCRTPFDPANNDRHIQGNITPALQLKLDQLNVSLPPPIAPTDMDPASGFTPAGSSVDVLNTIRLLHIKTVKKIPGPCKILATKIFDKAFSDVAAHPDNLNYWAILHMLPKAVLCEIPSSHLPKRRKKYDVAKLQSNYTLARLRRWLSGPAGQLELWQDILQRGKFAPGRHRPAKPQPQAAANCRRCKELAANGRLSDALKALISSGVADFTEEVLAELRAKHPQAADPPVNPVPPPTALQVEIEDVIKAMRSFPKGSAGGRDGFWPQYYVDFLSCPVAVHCDGLVKSFTSPLTIICVSLEKCHLLLLLSLLLPPPTLKSKGGILVSSFSKENMCELLSAYTDASWADNYSDGTTKGSAGGRDGFWPQ